MRPASIRDIGLQQRRAGTRARRAETWLGRPWIETVAEDSRPKVEALLTEQRAGAMPRAGATSTSGGRDGTSLPHPVLRRRRSATPAGAWSSAATCGRSRSLQQRLVEAQQSMERDYSRLRQAETRYRLLFQMSVGPGADPRRRGTAVLGGESQRPSACSACDASACPAARCPRSSRPRTAVALQALLASVRTAGRADDVRGAARRGRRRTCMVSASPFRQERRAARAWCGLTVPQGEAGRRRAAEGAVPSCSRWSRACRMPSSSPIRTAAS